MNSDLSGKTVVVTGASRGIGMCTARAFHQAGAIVAITGRHEETLSETAKEVGERCYPFICDQRDPDAIEKMATEVIKELGDPDILINNAGMMKSLPVLEMSRELWDQVMETNVRGPFLTSRAFLPGMIKKNKGDIVMISSMSGKKGDPGASVYAASKFGLQGFSQSLMHEVRRNNIRVMVVNPSMVDKSEHPDRDCGEGLTLHALDLADTIVHMVALPGRTMIRDMDVFGTNPF